MKIRHYLLGISLLLFTIYTTQAQEDCATETQLTIAVPEGPAPWSSLELNNNPCNFQFAIVTDRTGGHRPGIFMEGIRRLNLLQPEFVMSVGDLIEGYTEDRDRLDQEWNEFDGFIDSLEMPFFYLPGNHDITNAVMEEVWKERFGPTYYHFVYKDVLFLCLNSEDQYRGSNKGTISDAQYEYIEKTLANNADVNYTLVFMHQPLWILEDTERWEDVETLLADRKHSVFVGHHHTYAKYNRNNGKYFMLATTGGGSRLRGPQLGEFDHVVWVTMTAEGPIMANLQLEGIWDENVVTEQTKSFFSTIRESRPIQPDALLVKTNDFSEGTIQIKLVNDQNVPMQVKLKNRFSWDLKSDLNKNEVLVNPNSTEFVDLSLQSRGKANLEAIQMVKLEASARYIGEGTPSVAIPFNYIMGPVPVHQLSKTSKKMMVDGNLNDWSELPYRIQASSAEDLQAQFNLNCDEHYLYLAVDVKDNNLVKDTASAVWQQDYLEFTLNAEPTKESSLNTGGDGFATSLRYAITPETDDLPSTVLYNGEPVKDMQVLCQQSEKGYILEAKIPLSYITSIQGNNWKSLRFNLMLRDPDKNKNKRPRYYWQPAWNSDQNRLGSGMFFN